MRLSSVYETKDVIRENSTKGVPKMSPRTIFFKLATQVEANFGQKGKSGGAGGGEKGGVTVPVFKIRCIVEHGFLEAFVALF